jgi:hypothetical protein
MMSPYLREKSSCFYLFELLCSYTHICSCLNHCGKRGLMRVTVHIPDDLGPKLKQAANNEGLSISALTAKALKKYLAQRRKKTAGSRLLGLIGRDSVTADALEELERGRIDDRT